jgi:tetratricopeptide (TPR) repeat protein
MKPKATNNNCAGPKARRRLLLTTMLAIVGIATAWATPFIPLDDSQVLAQLPPGVSHTANVTREGTRLRLDVAVPLAQFYITRARASGDLRYLGYAEGILEPWLEKSPVAARVLVLEATILQSRHEFNAALGQLDRALEAQPDDAQAWLTRATVLRVLGRYDEASTACTHLADKAGASVTALCEQSLRGLTGHLQTAYVAIESLPLEGFPAEARAWRYSELGEMAERLGHDGDAERWFRDGLRMAPDDFYLRTALADLLLRHDRAAETLELLTGYESMEPMLLRVVLAHQELGDARLAESAALLSNAFELEERRGDTVHRREQARFLLDIGRQPDAALAAAQQNWLVQREPDDALILLRAAQAAHRPEAASGVLTFMQQRRLEDIRLDAYTRSLR